MTEKTKNVPAEQKSAVPATAGLPGLGLGHETPTEIEDLTFPRAKLIQATSEEAQAEDEGLHRKPGSLINSATKEDIGNIFIPIFNEIRFVKWNPRKKDDPAFDPAFEPGEKIFETSNRRDPRVMDGQKFGPNGEAPEVTKYFDFFCYFPGSGSPFPLWLSFHKTSAQAGSNLLTMTKMSGGNMFDRRYKIIISQKENAGTKFYVMTVLPSGICSPEEAITAKQIYDSFRGKAIKIAEDKPSSTD